MSQVYGQKQYTSVDQIIGKPSGWYTFRIFDTNVPVYVEMGWGSHPQVLVIQNRQYTGGMKNLNTDFMLNRANYRIGTTSQPGRINSSTTLSDFNCFVAPKFWEFFGKRYDSRYIRVTQYVAPTVGTRLSDTNNHARRASWVFTGFASNWGFQGAGSVVRHLGSTNPSFYSYHAANGYGLSSTNACADNYGYHPWWYGHCWSGNYFGSTSGSHQDRPYWTGSGSDHHAFGGIYIS